LPPPFGRFQRTNGNPLRVGAGWMNPTPAQFAANGVVELSNGAAALSGPRLIVSDSPEKLAGLPPSSVLWRTRIEKAVGPAPFRVYLYHLNDHTSLPANLVLLARSNFISFKQTLAGVFVARQSPHPGDQDYIKVGNWVSASVERGFMDPLVVRYQTPGAPNLGPGAIAVLDTITIPPSSLTIRVYDIELANAHLRAPNGTTASNRVNADVAVVFLAHGWVPPFVIPTPYDPALFTQPMVAHDTQNPRGDYGGTEGTINPATFDAKPGAQNARGLRIPPLTTSLPYVQVLPNLAPGGLDNRAWYGARFDVTVDVYNPVDRDVRVRVYLSPQRVLAGGVPMPFGAVVRNYSLQVAGEDAVFSTTSLGWPASDEIGDVRMDILDGFTLGANQTRAVHYGITVAGGAAAPARLIFAAQ
jgi:hypothetical protein